MTTKIERRLFGILAGTQTVQDGENGSFLLNPLNDRKVEVLDRPDGTHVDVIHATVEEMLVRLLMWPDISKDWKVDAQENLQSGTSMTVGPAWNRIRITRE